MDPNEIRHVGTVMLQAVELPENAYFARVFGEMLYQFMETSTGKPIMKFGFSIVSHDGFIGASQNIETAELEAYSSPVEALAALLPLKVTKAFHYYDLMAARHKDVASLFAGLLQTRKLFNDRDFALTGPGAEEFLRDHLGDATQEQLLVALYVYLVHHQRFHKEIL